jgi:UDP-glucose 4-epimerase
MKIVVTGVAGMIGSHLSELLLAGGHEVLGIDDFSVGTQANISSCIEHSKFDWLDQKLQDLTYEEKFFQDVEVIVHLAAHKKIVENQMALPLFETNVAESERIIKFCVHTGIKLVFASTSDVYGHGTSMPFGEEDDIRLGSSTAKRWAYAVSKLFVEQLVQSYTKEKGLIAVTIRYFGGFSERSNFSWSGGHVPIFIDAIRHGTPIPIHGDGEQTRSIGHADDLARGTQLAIENLDRVSGEIINIGNDEEISINESINIITRLMGREPGSSIVDYIPEENVFGSYKDIRRRKPDLRKARDLLGYKPQISFEETIKRVLRKIK